MACEQEAARRRQAVERSRADAKAQAQEQAVLSPDNAGTAGDYATVVQRPIRLSAGPALDAHGSNGASSRLQPTGALDDNADNANVDSQPEAQVAVG